jgi:hypothetical protein
VKTDELNFKTTDHFDVKLPPNFGAQMWKFCHNERKLMTFAAVLLFKNRV